jgi:hypothetical protein
VTEFKKYNRRRARLHQTTAAQIQVCVDARAGSLLFSIFIFFFTARLEI